MSIIDSYGSFDLPEEKFEIEVVEDPVKVISSAWKLFERDVKEVYVNSSSFIVSNVVEDIYKKALKCLEGKDKVKVNSNHLLELLISKEESIELKGLFLSAVHNATDMKTLLVEEIRGKNYREYRNNVGVELGYKLKKDKNIVLGPKVKVHSLGHHSKGNVINRGIVHETDMSITGVKINFGEIERVFMNEPSRSTLYLNQNKIIGVTPLYPTLQENFINNGEIWNLHKGIDLINLGKIGSKDKSGKILNLKKIDKTLHLKQKLEEKLKEIEFLKDTTDIKKIDKFDFSKFKDETIEINKEIIREIYK